MKRIFFAVTILILAHQAAFAQKTDEGPRPYTEPEKGFNPRNLMVGGALGLSFGDYTFVNVSPMIGYRFSRMFAAGVNINAQYSSGKSYEWGTNNVVSRNKYTMFGGGLWGRFYPLEQFFVHAQPEYNFISAKITEYNPRQEYKDRYGAASLLLGGGYSQPIGGNSAITFMVLYDVLQDKNTPYLNRPIFSGGVNIGL